MIAYGYHKDYRLFEVLETMSYVTKRVWGKRSAGYLILPLWLCSVVISLMEMETEYTHCGCGRHNLTVRPDLFPEYHGHLLSNEKW